MAFEALHPFSGYVWYVVKNSDDRRMVCLVRKGNRNDRTTVSLARYTLSVHLWRRLEKWEHVDHIDGDKRHDELSNLQILTNGENAKKYHVQSNSTKKMVAIKCPVCDTSFALEYRNARIREKNQETISCSTKCKNESLKKGFLAKSTHVAEIFFIRAGTIPSSNRRFSWKEFEKIMELKKEFDEKQNRNIMSSQAKK